MDNRFNCSCFYFGLLLRSLHESKQCSKIRAVLQARKSNVDVKNRGKSPCLLHWVINEKVEGITPVRFRARSRDAPRSLR
nr:MAG TPA: hypothetical protein [Caudoviricetes sp.]